MDEGEGGIMIFRAELNSACGEQLMEFELNFF